MHLLLHTVFPESEFVFCMENYKPAPGSECFTVQLHPHCGGVVIAPCAFSAGIPGGELFSTVQNRYGQILYSYLVPNISFNCKDAMCQTVCTRHGLQEGWVFCALHAL